MKKQSLQPIRQILAGVLLFFVVASLYPSGASAQVMNETTKKKISVGVGMFTDIWMDMSSGNVQSGVKSRTINQGVDLLATYNIPFGKSPLSFAIGLGLDCHNLYGNFLVDSYSDSTKFIKIPDTIKYKKSKLTITYLTVPIEFRWKTQSMLTFAVGFKGGMLLGSGTKYVGDDYIFDKEGQMRVKFKKVKNLEQFTYGPTIRFGYRWININAQYMLSSIFNKNNTPEMYPISIGIILMPF
ncbi:MAG: outer membrane beta-barrel protein [Bacteroidota bacterium]|nr:outer membrane beta-barrel protein [Bacteroidota bacterium]